MLVLLVHYKIVSIDGIILGFALGIIYKINLGTIESTDLGSLIGSYEWYQNGKLGGSLNIINWRWNCVCHSWWFNKWYGIGTIIWNCTGILG